jgi:hypothetical protein
MATKIELFTVLSCALSLVSAANERNKTIRIGYFLQDTAPPYRVGAINLAIRQAQDDGLMPGYNFRYLD